MTWRQAVRAALDRYCRRRHSPDVDRAGFIDEELAHILRDAPSRGQTPEQTLGRALQDLRDAGVLEFRGRGRYRLTNWPH